MGIELKGAVSAGMSDSSMISITLASLYYDEAFPSGANKRFSALANALCLEGCQVSVVINERTAVADFSPEILVHRVPYRRGIGRMRTWFHLRRAIQRSASDVAISDFFPPIHDMGEIPVFLLVHDLRNKTKFGRNNLGRGLTSRVQLAFFCTVRRMIVVSKFTKADVEASLPANSVRQILVSYNAAEPEFVEMVPFEQRAENSIIFVSNFEPRKNHLGLIRALRGLRASLDLVGNDLGSLQSVKTELEKSEYADLRVRFHSNVTQSELVRLYNKSRVMAFPSVYEGFGMPLVEASLCGCNIICSDLPVFREVISGADFIDFSNVDQVASSLRAAFENRQHQQVQTPTSWQQVATDLIADLRAAGLNKTVGAP